MTMHVLQRRTQISQSRRELNRRGLSALDSPIWRALSRLRVHSFPVTGDRVKSWDVLTSVDFIERKVPKSAEILDIGAYSSEILSILYRLGYRKLAGVDLNPRVERSPHAGEIRYEICDFLHTPFENETFGAITSISVIEHGFQRKELLREMSRLLRPGGYFIASFDYWPEKIDTKGQQFFGLDWLIFSAADVQMLVDEALDNGLVPCGPLDFEALEKPIKCANHRYTFGWLVLQKG